MLQKHLPNLKTECQKEFPIDEKNRMIIMPNNIEISVICTNKSSVFNDLQKKENERVFQ